MLILKVRAFHKWAKKIKLSDEALRKAVDEVAKGRYEAHLGGDIYKKRVALGNRGKSAGARTIVALKKGDKAFLVYGYGKNERANINVSHRKALIEYAKDLFALNSAKMAKSINDGEFTEVK